jgi:CelD/BcsL family acetyltransferase involved in cellulose biosynthesis
MAIRDTNDVSCEVIDSYNLIDQALEKEWDELVVETKGCIYLTCAWSRIWWEFYGKENILRIFIYRRKDKLVGVLPIYIERIRIGLIKTRVARLVGAYNPSRVFDVPINKEYAEVIGVHLVKFLLRTDRCDIVSIGSTSDECEAKETLFAAVKKMQNESGIVKEVSFGVYTYFYLPDTYEAYIQSLSSNERKNRRKYELKLLNKEYDNVRLEVFHTPEDIQAEMPHFIALHKAQWNLEGKRGYFGAWPQAEAFHRYLAVELAHLGRTRLIKITAGGKPILYQYSYIFGDCCYWQLPARAAGEEWNRFSLGATALVVLIRKTIEENITKIEGGVSHYEYKTRLGAIDSNISVLRVVADRPMSIAKYYLCVQLQKLYLYLYFKLWYLRIQPKLPSSFHRPIWVTFTKTIF